jgi:hypothetical protein
MAPFEREESPVVWDRALAPNHPRIVEVEPTSPNSLQAIGGSIGKYSDRERCMSAMRSAPCFGAEV